MKFLKSKDEYEKAMSDLAKKNVEVEDLERAIQNYKNEILMPVFDVDGEEFRQWLSEQPSEGTFFKYLGNDYEILDIEYFIQEYGSESWYDATDNGSFKDLLDGGSVGVIGKR